MNTAGLPGTGIGGLFYLLAIVYMLIAEVLLTLRGKSSKKRWLVLLEQLGIGSAMIGVAWLISDALSAFLFQHHARQVITTGSITTVSSSVIQNYPVLVPFVLLFVVFLLVQLLRLVLIARTVVSRYKSTRQEHILIQPTTLLSPEQIPGDELVFESKPYASAKSAKRSTEIHAL